MESNEELLRDQKEVIDQTDELTLEACDTIVGGVGQLTNASSLSNQSSTNTAGEQSAHP
jgi:hypothetical protein